MSDKKSHQRPWRTLVTTMAAAGVLGLAGCTDEGGTTGGDSSTAINDPSDYTERSPKELAQESKASYANNENGLIAASKLRTWIDDWENNKPDGVSGRLVILQVGEGNLTDYRTDPDGDGEFEPTERKYITPNEDEGVAVYPIDHNDLRMERSNGVTSTRSMVADGPTIDSFLQKHNIYPDRDMIVMATGAGSGFEAMKLGRAWYTMRYWGVDKEHLAVLNGGAQTVMNFSDANLHDYMGSSSSSVPAQPGNFTVRDLKTDNTSLQVTLEEVLDAAKNEPDDVFIWDARNMSQYEATEDPFQNGGATQGHPKGAVSLRYGSLLVGQDSTNGADADDDSETVAIAYQDGGNLCPSDDEYDLDTAADTNTECTTSTGPSYRWRDKAVLEAALNGEAITQTRYTENAFQDTNGKLGAGEAWQDGQQVWSYCETTYRAMVTGFASAAVLGIPTRFYDGAMVEWHAMAKGYDKYGNQLLPADSPWRTDKDAISYFEYNEQNRVDSRKIDNAYAEHSDAIIRADRAYKVTGASGDDSSSDDGGGAPVANPCGG